MKTNAIEMQTARCQPKLALHLAPQLAPRLASRLAILVAAALLAGPIAASASVSSDLDSLGGNDATLSRAGKLSAKSETAIVQGRTVDRHNRLELGVGYGGVAGGNSYLSTQNLGLHLDYHIVPEFSVGVRAEKSFNQLTNEGQSAYDAARAQQAAGSGPATLPDVDSPNYSVMGTATWYMFYGKLNFLDLKVVQFDVYSLAGAGQMTTLNDVSPTYTAGGGIAFWLSQHFTTRFEIRYQTYKDKPYTGERNLNLIIGEASIGVLL